MKKYLLTGFSVLMSLAFGVVAAPQGTEKGGTKYDVVGQRVGILYGKEVAVTLYRGAPFKPEVLKTEGEMTIPLTIKITDFKDGHLIPDPESRVPVYEHYDPATDKIERKMFTHAANVTWQFIKGVSPSRQTMAPTSSRSLTPRFRSPMTK